MKKLLLMSVALLAFGASMAFAQAGSVNLAWNLTCRAAATSATQDNLSTTIAGVPCNDSTDPMSAAPTKTLTAAFKNTQTLPDFSGSTTTVEITGAAITPGSIWDVTAAGCNPSALSAKPAVANTITNCTQPYLGDANGQGNFTNVAFSPGKITYINNRVRNSSVAPLGAPTTAGGWVSDQLVFDFDSAAQTQGCPGCTAQLDWGVKEIQYFSPSQTFFATTPDLKACVGLNGGTGANCAGGTPAQKSTWGSVKALYR